MGTDYRGSAGMQCIKETVFSGMAQVNHHACAVHLPNDLMTEITQSAMFMTGFGSGITDVVGSSGAGGAKKKTAHPGGLLFVLVWGLNLRQRD